MGIRELFHRLFGKANPTAEWQEDPSHPLDVDFGVPSLGDVTFDQPVVDLSWLGPADEADDSSIVFYSKGLQLFPVNGELNSWGVEFRKHSGFQPFGGTCLWNGKSLELSAETTPDDLFAQLGDSRANDLDNTGRTEMLHYGKAEFEFSDDNEGNRTLSAIVCLGSLNVP